MGSLEERAKELAAPRIAQRQREQEEKEAWERRSQAMKVEAEENARRIRALAREFVSLARKYGANPRHLYSDAHEQKQQDGSYRWHGDGPVQEVWLVRPWRGWVRTGEPLGLAVNAEGEAFHFLERDDFLQEIKSPYVAIHQEDIERAAAWIAGGEEVHSGERTPPPLDSPEHAFWR